MAELKFSKSSLGSEGDALYDAYEYLYSGLASMGETDAPETGEAPELELDENGNVTEESETALNEYIEETQAEIDSHNDIQRQNAAYLFAYSIVTFGGNGTYTGSGSSSSGYLSLGGGYMSGALYALNEFYAGANETVMLSVTSDGVIIDDDTQLSVKLISLGDEITIEGGDDEELTITSETVTIDGTLWIGNIEIDGSEIYISGKELYSADNANNEYTDWTMYNAYVYGDLSVEGASTFKGFLSALYGFELGVGETKLIYSIEADEETDTAAYISLSSDINIEAGYSLKLDNNEVLFLEDDAVNIAAPGMVIKLGATVDDVATDHISLRTSIYNYSDTYELITREGAGYFPNSLRAQYATGGDLVLSTYSGVNDNGVVFQEYVRIGDTDGPAFHADKDEDYVKLYVDLPYYNYDGDTTERVEITHELYYDSTVSAIDGDDATYDVSLNVKADANFITFVTPIQSTSYSIPSDTSKTLLKDSVLYLAENLFVEGVTGETSNHFTVNGDTYFTGDIRSSGFSSGFSGYGWAVIDDDGSYSATFDELTVRQKFRVYEMEVQKITATNGSLWVSDSCSGDSVTEVE